MAANVTADPDTRVIEITKVPVSGVSSIDVVTDIYTGLKDDWRTTAALQRLRFPLRSFGDPKTPTRTIGPYVFLDNGSGWRIRPYDVDHELTVVGNVVAEDVTLPVWLARAGRSILVLEEQSSQALTAAVGSGLTSAQSTQLSELYQLRGLLTGAPATYADTLISVNGVEVAVTDNGDGSYTLTRQ